MKCFIGLLLCLSLAAQAPPARPKVFGVAHYSVFVTDLAKTRAFYEDFLGYQEAFTLPKPDGSVQMVFLKINDHQYVELVNEPNKGEGQLNHLGLYTDDVERMRQYLASRGVKVPDQVTKNRIGNIKISVVDPDGQPVVGAKVSDFGFNEGARGQSEHAGWSGRLGRDSLALGVASGFDSRAFVSLSGTTLRSETSSGGTIVSKADGEVTNLDANNALSACVVRTESLSRARSRSSVLDATWARTCARPASSSRSK